MTVLTLLLTFKVLLICRPSRKIFWRRFSRVGLTRVRFRLTFLFGLTVLILTGSCRIRRKWVILFLVNLIMLNTFARTRFMLLDVLEVLRLLRLTLLMSKLLFHLLMKKLILRTPLRRLKGLVTVIAFIILFSLLRLTPL